MNIKKIILPALLLPITGAGSWNMDAAEPVPKTRNEWRLIWSDEFDKAGKPDPKKWVYEREGFLRNEEMQWYTSDEKNVYVKDGCLHLVARLENKPNPWYKEGSGNWKFNRKNIEITSAGLITSTTFTFLYGRAEMRAKLPVGQGVWPAFWTLGTDTRYGDWPAKGEIDIFEFWKDWQGIYTLQSTVHWQDQNKKHLQSGKKIINRNFTDDFHIFAMEWDPEKIVFFFDKEPIFTFKTGQCSIGDFNPFRAPHFLLLNLAIGGSLGGKVDKSIFPAEYIIDYVRIYQKTEIGTKQ